MNDMKTIHKILYKNIVSNIRALFLVILLMLLIVGFDVIAPWPFKILIDNVLAANPIVSDKFNFLNLFNSRELLGFFVVFVYFVSTFLLTIVEYLRSIVSKKIIKKITADFSKSAFKSLQSLAIGFYKKQQIGDYIYRLSYDVYALGELIEDGLLPLITSCLYLAVTASIMFFIDVRLTLFSLAALPFLAIGLYSFNTYVAQGTKRSEFFNSAAFSFIEEALTHLKIIQAFSQEHRESHRFDKKIDVSLQSEVVVSRLDFLISLLVGVIIAVSYSVIIIYGIRLVFSGTITTGLLIVFIFYLDNLTNPILSIIDAATVLKQSYIKIVRMEDFFTPKTHLNYHKGKVNIITDTGIVFDHVSLWDSHKIKMLHNLTFEIEPNKRTVIFGVNGSGKTSVVNLIMRFVDAPSAGKIYVGGIDLNDYDIEALRSAIAFIPQEITLFDDTIRNNIGFGNPKSSFSDIKRAARLAAADEFIKKLPKGYHFKVGEGGNFLSGGQRQRIMLARALLKKDAKILLFDETLSALDVKTRKAVIEHLYQFSRLKTMIIVSNIFEVVRTADNVIVLDKGRVVFSGPSSRLPREVALYKLIVESEHQGMSNEY